MGGVWCIYYTVLLLNMTIRLSTLVDYPLHPEYPLRFITLQPYILGNLEGLVPLPTVEVLDIHGNWLMLPYGWRISTALESI